MSADALTSSVAWRAGWTFLNAGCYWEAHEVWEAVWLALPPNSAERRFVQAVIQLANALLKEKMNRPNAARRLAEVCLSGLSGLSESVMAVRIETVSEQADSLLLRVARNDA